MSSFNKLFKTLEVPKSFYSNIQEDNNDNIINIFIDEKYNLFSCDLYNVYIDDTLKNNKLYDIVLIKDEMNEDIKNYQLSLKDFTQTDVFDLKSIINNSRNEIKRILEILLNNNILNNDDEIIIMFNHFSTRVGYSGRLEQFLDELYNEENVNTIHR
jgi:hypothetical protein